MVAVLSAPTVEVAPRTSTRTFGIELECEVPRDYLEEGGRSVGGYEDRLTGTFTHPDTDEEFEAEVTVWVPEEEMDGDGEFSGDFVSDIENLPEGTRRWSHWEVRSDCSLSEYHGGTMAEVVSPVLAGADGIDAIQQFGGVLANNYARVNNSCGLHVHVGDESVDKQQLDDLFDHFLYAFYGQSGSQACKRKNASWCRPRDTCRDPYKGRAIRLDGEPGDTYEIRVFAPTTEPINIIGAVCMAVGLGEWVASGDAQLDELPAKSHDPRTAMANLWDFIGKPEYLPALPEGVTIDDVMGRCFANADTAARSLGCD